MKNEVFLRPWKHEDAAALTAICNNKKIWLNMHDRFPHPYTVQDALAWIAYTLTKKPIQNFAVLFKGVVVGSVGITPKEDIHRKMIEVGYFVGEHYWGKGIATHAVSLVLQYIQQHFDVVRVYAEVFEHNSASMKVLEKNGFYLESKRKKTVLKNNLLMDDMVWVKIIGQ